MNWNSYHSKFRRQIRPPSEMSTFAWIVAIVSCFLPLLITLHNSVETSLTPSELWTLLFRDLVFIVIIVSGVGITESIAVAFNLFSTYQTDFRDERSISRLIYVFGFFLTSIAIASYLFGYFTIPNQNVQESLSIYYWIFAIPMCIGALISSYLLKVSSSRSQMNRAEAFFVEIMRDVQRDHHDSLKPSERAEVR